MIIRLWCIPQVPTLHSIKFSKSYMGNSPSFPYTKTPDGVQQSLFLLCMLYPAWHFLILIVTQFLILTVTQLLFPEIKANRAYCSIPDSFPASHATTQTAYFFLKAKSLPLPEIPSSPPFLFLFQMLYFIYSKKQIKVTKHYVNQKNTSRRCRHDFKYF